MENLLKYYHAIATGNSVMSLYYAYLLGYINKAEFDRLRANPAK
jgi:hypothetical protein